MDNGCTFFEAGMYSFAATGLGLVEYAALHSGSPVTVS